MHLKIISLSGRVKKMLMGSVFPINAFRYNDPYSLHGSVFNFILCHARMFLSGIRYWMPA
jgi:hypothetical protein